ncbi:hypothetical protein [Erythrobacter donghaensis]|uniref:hypothetical protein n=1 Tax=Erythrobacter donghaensis TaxID=267135 RepID=UPI000A35F87E|nr:hypothetical protein [Erythrobacter donghaensis]
MNKASIFMAASWTGLGALILTAVAAVADAPLVVAVPLLLLVIGSSYVMLATRRADEYTEGLWNAGASVAFGTMLLTFLGLPAAEGFFDGVTGTEDGHNIPATVVPILAIAAFYIGLFVKRLLGDM